MNRKTVYVKNGGKYAAQQRLAHTFAPIGSEVVSTATITFLGETIEKRLLINSAGMFELLLSDVLDAIKTNTYSFKPFSDFALDEFKPLTIEGDFDSISIDVLNAIDSPDSFVNSGDFMSRNTEIQFDERFEQGFNFYGEIEIERETTEGSDTLTIGQTGELNFVSFRELLRLPSTPAISYYNGTTTNAVQGETATYEVTADNLTGNAGAVEVVIDFGGTIGTDSQTVNFAANETGKIITFTKLIPSDEGTPRTAEITDDVGSVPYTWSYAVTASAIKMDIYSAAGATSDIRLYAGSDTEFLIDWGAGAGFEQTTIGASEVSATNTYASDGYYSVLLRPLDLADWHELAGLRTYDIDVVGDLDLSSASNLKDVHIRNQQNIGDVYVNTSEDLGLVVTGNQDLKMDIVAAGFTDSYLAGISMLIFSNSGNTEITHNTPPSSVNANISSNTGTLFFSNLNNHLNGNSNFGIRTNASINAVLPWFSDVSTINMDYDSNNFQGAEVDEIINETASSATANNVQNKALKIGGNNAAPTSASTAAIATLQGLGWTVTTS